MGSVWWMWVALGVWTPAMAGDALAGATPLEVVGHGIYVRDGCVACHSKPEVGGETTAAADALGPDLDLIGGRFPDAWHHQHLKDPRSTSPGSTMPAYPLLFTQTIDGAAGGPELKAQAEASVGRLANANLQADWDHEIVALTAFLQHVGAEERAKQYAEAMAAKAADEEAAATAWRTGVEEGDPAMVQAGKAIYEQSCAACHRTDLTGGIGPSLVDDAWIHGGEPEQILATIRDGVAAKGMPGWGPILGEEKLGQVAAYVVASARAADGKK